MTFNIRPHAAAALGAIAAAIIVLSFSSPVIRLPFAFLLVAFLPGWAFLRAVTAATWQPLETIVMAMSLSLALTIIGGFVLHFAHAIDTNGWLIWSVALTLLNCGIATVRDRGGSNLAVSVEKQRLSLSRILHPNPQVLSFTGAAFFVALAIVMAIRSSLALQSFHYTELWINPGSHDTASQLNIGLRNGEGEKAAYKVQLMIGRQLVQVWDRVEIEPGETWHTTFDRVGIDRYPRAEVWAYKTGIENRIYRHVWLAGSTAPETDRPILSGHDSTISTE